MALRLQDHHSRSKAETGPCKQSDGFAGLSIGAPVSHISGHRLSRFAVGSKTTLEILPRLPTHLQLTHNQPGVILHYQRSAESVKLQSDLLQAY